MPQGNLLSARTIVKNGHVLHDADGREEQRQLHDCNDGSVQAVVDPGAHGENGLQAQAATCWPNRGGRQTTMGVCNVFLMQECSKGSNRPWVPR